MPVKNSYHGHDILVILNSGKFIVFWVLLKEFYTITGHYDWEKWMRMCNIQNTRMSEGGFSLGKAQKTGKGSWTKKGKKG